MKFGILVSMVGLMVAGCTWEPSRIPPCEGEVTENCLPVVYFSPDSYEISPHGQEKLDKNIEKMEQWPAKQVLIEGHSYEWGGDDYNKELSQCRAQAVEKYLIEKGIDPERIQVDSCGLEKPVCEDKKCRNLNRRTIVEMYNP
ncbi:MAG: OmpA family protein [Alphaproteobacteria bacterium]|nr:OmpA family protein [Alphaproteobacteria bacterium]